MIRDFRANLSRVTGKTRDPGYPGGEAWDKSMKKRLEVRGAVGVRNLKLMRAGLLLL